MNLIMDRPEIDKIIESCPDCQLDVNKQLIELFNRHKVVIYIKNIDVFAEVTRQTFLYEFFDNINSHSMKVTVILSSNNLFFLNKLERRVKSRLSMKVFYFDSYDFEEDLMKILESKIEQSRFPEFSAIMKGVINEESVKSFLKRYHSLGMSIDWFVKLFRFAFILVNCSVLEDIFKEASSDAVAIEEGSFYMLDKLNSAKSMIINGTNQILLLNSLPKPAKLILYVLNHKIKKTICTDVHMSFDRFNKRKRELLQEDFDGFSNN